MTRKIKLEANNGDMKLKLTCIVTKKCYYDAHTFYRDMKFVSDAIHKALMDKFHAHEITFK